MKNLSHTTTNAQFQFFKAICFNGNHYLCDFSNEVSQSKEVTYLVDIEMPGAGNLHVEMKQAEDSQWHFTMPVPSHNELESVLDEIIYAHNMLN